MRKMKIVIASLLLSLSCGYAQNASVPNVLNLKSAKQSGQILEKNKIVGYYVFFTKEKADKANTTYEVELFDDNYNKTGSFEITRPNKSLLLEMVFNGQVFMLHYYDSKTGYEFATYDRAGKLQGSNKISKDDLSKYEVARVQQNAQSATENVTIYPTGTNGFVRTTFTKNSKMGYEVVAYDNNAKVLWTSESPSTSEKLETIEIVDVTENVISATISKKKNLMTKEVDQFCLLLNTSDGKTIKEFQLGTDDSGRKTILKSFINEKTSSIMLVGEYYKPKDDFLKDKSQGLYLMELAMDGSEKSSTEYSWKTDISKFKQESLDEEDKKDADKPYYMFFHDVVISENGHIFLIGEQFKKQLSAGGVAGNLASAALGGGGSGASSFEILVANMLVIEFDATKKMIDFDLIQKKKTSVLLPAGMGAYGATFLGYYIKTMGGFDYSFTSRNAEADAFDVVYIDANRKEEKNSKKSDLMVGVISIKSGAKDVNRVPINCTSSIWWVQPGKPGYISVSEYFRKEKKIDMRLEALSY